MLWTSSMCHVVFPECTFARFCTLFSGWPTSSNYHMCMHDVFDRRQTLVMQSLGTPVFEISCAVKRLVSPDVAQFLLSKDIPFNHPIYAWLKVWQNDISGVDIVTCVLVGQGVPYVGPWAAAGSPLCCQTSSLYAFCNSHLSNYQKCRAGDDLLSKVVNAAISTPILYEAIMKPMARRTLIQTVSPNMHDMNG